MPNNQVPQARTFVGGMWWPPGTKPLSKAVKPDLLADMGGNVTWPFVKLCMHTQGIDITPSSFFFRGIIPRFHFGRSDITAVEALRRGGIRLRIVGMQQSIIFWSFHSTRVLNALEQRGVAVDRQPQAVGWFI